MKPEQVVSYFFIGFFLFILYQLVLIFSPFFRAISWAAILAFAFYPLYQKIQSLPRINRSLAAIAVTALIILIVILPAAVVLISLMREAVELYYKLSVYISAGNLERFLEQIRQTATADWARELWLRWHPVQTEMTQLVLQGAKGVGNFAAIQLAILTKNLFFWALNFILIAFLLFFFLRDGKLIYEFLYQMIPMAKKNKQTLSRKIDETFSAVIRGQFVTSIAQATLAGFAFWFLALPLPFFFGFLTFLTSMIPITGAATVWVPFAIYLFGAQEFEKAITLSAIGVFGISLSDNLLKPILIGGKTKLPIFLLFLGILGGMKLYGFTGIFLGPVVLALFFVLAKIYREEYPAEI